MTLSATERRRMLAALATPNVAGPSRPTPPQPTKSRRRTRERAAPVVPPPPPVRATLQVEQVPPWPHQRVDEPLPSAGNAREFHLARNRRVDRQRAQGRVCMTRLARWLWVGPLPLRVRMVRVAPRPLDDDNLRAAFKAVRDGIAEALGVDDGPREGRVAWEYGQELGTAGWRVELPGVGA